MGVLETGGERLFGIAAGALRGHRLMRLADQVDDGLAERREGDGVLDGQSVEDVTEIGR